MRKRWFASLALSCLLPLMLLACGAAVPAAPAGSGTAGTATPAASETAVHMNSANFVQAEITLQKGQSVRLINDDPLTPHIIANGTWVNGTAQQAKEPNAPEARNVQINGNAQATIGPFTTAGTFKFYCTIHPGMNLTILVQ